MRPLSPAARRRRKLIMTALLAAALGLIGIVLGVSMGVLLAEQFGQLPDLTLLPSVGPTEQAATATVYAQSIKATFFRAVTRELLSLTPRPARGR